MAKVYWISWYERDCGDINEKIGETLDREGMRTWLTGQTIEKPQKFTMCSRIESESQEAAEERILRLYENAPGLFVEWRFCQEHPEGWQPGDRFL